MTCILEKSPWWVRHEEGWIKAGQGRWRRLTMSCILPDEGTNGGGSTQALTKQRILAQGQYFGEAEAALHFEVESAYHDIDASQANARAAQVGGRTLGCCAKVLPRSPALGPDTHTGFWTSLSLSRPHRRPTHIPRCHQRANCGLAGQEGGWHSPGLLPSPTAPYTAQA